MKAPWKEFILNIISRTTVFNLLIGLGLCILALALWRNKIPSRSDKGTRPVQNRPFGTYGPGSNELIQNRASHARKLPTAGGVTGVDDTEWERWWKRALGITTPEDASAFFDDLKHNVPSMSLRQSLGASVIRALAENGHDDAAWNLIDATYGGIRDAQVRGFFEGLSDPDRRINYFRSLKDEDDKISALGGILQKMGVTNLERLSDLPLKWNSAARNALANQVAFAFDVPGEQRRDPFVAKCAEDAVNSLVRLFEAGILDEKGVKIAIDTNNYYSAPKLLEMLDKLSDLRKADLKSSYEKVIGDYIAEDSSSAMRIVLGKTKIPSLVGVAVSRYYMYDSSGAVQWFSNSSSNMTPDQFDAGALFFFNRAIQSGEIESARAWANSLKSDKLREDANRKFNPKEEK